MGFFVLDVAFADAQRLVHRIEISENEQREPFTFSEKMDFAQMLEEIERAKAKERKSLGGKGGLEQDPPHGADVQRGETREIVADKIGVDKTSYDRAKYIAENASDEIIEELDKGQRSIRGTYDELKAKEETGKAPYTAPSDVSADDTEPMDLDDIQDIDSEPSKIGEKIKPSVKATVSSCHADILTKTEEEAIAKNKAFRAMSSEEKVVELQRQLKEARYRACTAEDELAKLKEFHDNLIYHKDGVIENLEARLADAEARVGELEALYCTDGVISA